MGQDQDQWSSFVYCTTTTFDNVSKLVILVHGTGVVRAGQWARSQIINESLEMGSQLSYIRQAKQMGFAVLVLNINENKRTINGVEKEIVGSENAEAHARTAWNQLISPATNLRHIGIVAFAYGAEVVVHLAAKRPDEFRQKVFAVAFSGARLPFHKYPNTFHILYPVS